MPGSAILEVWGGGGGNQARFKTGAQVTRGGGSGRGEGPHSWSFLPQALLGPIDTCAGRASVANIFLMSSRGLGALCAPGRIFSPADVWGEKGARGPQEEGGGTHKSLAPRGKARAQDFLLKFIRKTGFHSGPQKMYISWWTKGSFSTPPGAWIWGDGQEEGGAGTCALGMGLINYVSPPPPSPPGPENPRIPLPLPAPQCPALSLSRSGCLQARPGLGTNAPRRRASRAWGVPAAATPS